MRRVIMESPFAGKGETLEERKAQEARNVRYARLCLRDCLSHGEAPIASHLLYTQPEVLNDDIPDERTWGINAGLSWGSVADASVLYIDLGISGGMKYGIANAHAAGRPVEQRRLPGFQKYFPDEVQDL